MKKMRSFKQNLIGATFLSLALSASVQCPVRADDAKITIGTSTPSFQFTYAVAIVRGIKEEADKVGVDVISLDGKNDTAKQANDLDDLVAQGVKGIILQPRDAAVAPQMVEKLAAAGIPVVAASNQVGDPTTVRLTQVPDTLVALVAHDNEASGKLAAKVTIDLLPKDRQLKLAIVEGAAGYSDTVQRKDGYLNGLKELGANFDLVASQPGDWVAEKAESVCANVLSATPDADLIFASSDDMALGCSRAIKAAAASTLVIGLDGNEAIIPAIKSGDVAATVCNRPEDIGREAFKVLYEQLTGKENRKGKLVVVPTFVVTKANVDSCKPQF